MNAIEVKDDTMILRATNGVMWFGFTPERVEDILSALSKARKNANRIIDEEDVELARTLIMKDSIHEKIRGYTLLNYEYVGDFDTMHLMLKMCEGYKNVFTFIYIPKTHVFRNGTSKLNLVINE